MISFALLIPGLRQDNILTEQLEGEKCEEVWKHFKNYKSCIKTWDIAPAQDDEVSLYWQRFMYRFQRELKDLYGANIENIPKDWENISINRAIESLDNLRR